MPRIGERGWVHSGVKVVDNAAAPGGWNNLDLSGVVGKFCVLVALKIKNRSATVVQDFFFRRGGETEAVASSSSNASGNNIIKITNSNIGHIVMETDENGMLMWAGPSGQPTDIWLLGYIR